MDRRNGRGVPHSEVAELGVLGAVLLDQERAGHLLEALAPEDFADPGRRALFEAQRSLDREGSPIGVETLHERLREQGSLEAAGGMPALARLIDCDTGPEAAATLADQLRRYRLRRELLAAASDIAEFARREDLSAAALADRAETRILSLTARGGATEGMMVGAAALEALRQIEHVRESGGPPGLPTGLRGLDALIGGLKPGELLVVGGDTSSGKTALAGQIARHLSVTEGRRVVFYSFEMGEVDIAGRILLQEAGISLARAQRHDIGQADDEKLHRAAGRLRKAPLRLVRSCDLSAGELRARARREVRRRGAEMIVVDYLQLVPGEGGDTREQEVSGVTRELGRMARELEVPVLALAQLNRSHAYRGGNHRPRLSDLRESGAIEQNADVVLFVYRPGRYVDPSDPEYLAQRDQAELIVAKQRSGPLDTLPCRFRGELYRFEEVRPDEEASYRREKVRP